MFVNRVKILGLYGVFSLDQLQTDLNKFLETIIPPFRLKDIKINYNPSGYFAQITYIEDVKKTTNEQNDNKIVEEENEALNYINSQTIQQQQQELEAYQKDRLDKIKLSMRKTGRPRKTDTIN